MTALRVTANLVCVLGLLTLPGTFYRGVLAMDRVPLVLLIPIVLLAIGIRLRQISAPPEQTDVFELA